MKDLKSALFLFIFFFFFCEGYAQVHADIVGDVKIRGFIDINHPEDTTSLYIGRNVGLDLSPGIAARGNTFVGSDAGRSNMSGEENTFFGSKAGEKNNSSGNSFFGSLAGLVNTGSDNSFFGGRAGIENTTGRSNSFFGYEAGNQNTTGKYNSFFGKEAGQDNTIGERNSFFGFKAGHRNSLGEMNSFFGYDSGSRNNTGKYNSFFGYEADQENTTGTKNIFIGTSAGQLDNENSLDGAVALGFNAKVNCTNCAAIGGTGDDKVKVGINTPDPVSQLTIKQSTGGDSSGIRLIANTTNRSWEIRHTNAGDNLRFVALDDDGFTRVTQIDMRRSDGAFMVVSDKRLKKDIEYYDTILDKIVSIKPATYRWKNQPAQPKQSLGVIAQELEALFPTAVSTNEEGYKMVNYDALGVLAIQAIKEQQALIQKLGLEIEQLKKEKSDIHRRIEAIEEELKL